MKRFFNVLFLIYLIGLVLLNSCNTTVFSSAAAAPTNAPSGSSMTPTKQPSPVSTITPTKTPTSTQTVTPTSTEIPVCTSTVGSVEDRSIQTELLPKPMKYKVYLPRCYSFDTKTRYPVLYLLHGQGFSEDQWIRLGMVNSADRLISTPDGVPLIIVFPFDYSSKQPKEYKFEEVFIQQLLPAVDKEYRTLADGQHRAIGGLSRGGAWALHLGAKYPDLFSAIGGHSPAIFYNDEISLRKNLLAIPQSAMPRIWLDVGDNDSELVLISAFEQFLNANNFSYEWHVFKGWHDEKYWSAHVDEYLSWYMQAWK